MLTVRMGLNSRMMYRNKNDVHDFEVQYQMAQMSNKLNNISNI